MSESTNATSRKLRLRYPGKCVQCQAQVAAGTSAYYDRETKAVTCSDCFSRLGEQPDSDSQHETKYPSAVDEGEPSLSEPLGQDEIATEMPFYVGAAGASARSEFERRHLARQTRVNERFPRAGKVLLGIYGDPQSTKAWNVGAKGEELLGERLNRTANTRFRVLHDLRVPGTRSNLDHIVIAPRGVFVIDAKKYNGRPMRRVDGLLKKSRRERLMVGNRDRTALIEKVQHQIDLVSAAVDDSGVPVIGVLCFVKADWPLFGDGFEVKQIPVMSPKKLVKFLQGPGELNEAQIRSLQQKLAGVFPLAQ